ncbi:hypothetical protein OROMI_032832 [Orobanche minor]
MENEVNLPFKVGEEAEARSFETGYRGAWFRCKIIDIIKRNGEIGHVLDFYDFTDDKPEWTQLYQVPPYRKEKRRVLMLRPSYPPIYSSKQMPHASMISQVSVIVDDSWKVGDQVDWRAEDCLWCGTISHLLGDGRAKIKLNKPPYGEGSSYDVELKDVRPSLDWYPKYGWTIHTKLVLGTGVTVTGETIRYQNSQEGISSRRRAWLLKPLNQDSGELQSTGTPSQGQETEASQGTAGLVSSNSAVSDEVKSTGSTEIDKRSLRSTVPKKLKNKQKKSRSSGRRDRDPHSELTPAEPKADAAESTVPKRLRNKQEKRSSHGGSDPEPRSEQTPAESKADAADDDKLDSTCSIQNYPANGGSTLNSTRFDTLEAAVMDLEEYVNKIKWLKAILGQGISSSNGNRNGWEFVEPLATSDAPR